MMNNVVIFELSKLGFVSTFWKFQKLKCWSFEDGCREMIKICYITFPNAWGWLSHRSKNMRSKFAKQLRNIPSVQWPRSSQGIRQLCNIPCSGKQNSQTQWNSSVAASWLMAQSSWLKVHGSWLIAHGSWFKARGSWILTQGSWFRAQGSPPGPCGRDQLLRNCLVQWLLRGPE